MKYLAIGPGAMGLFVYLGVISKLKHLGALNDLCEISGSSAGSIIGFMFLATKGNIPEILDFAINVPVKQVMKPNLKSLLTNYGLVPISKVRAQLSKACLKYLGKDDITFMELFEHSRIKFHVSAYCVDLMKTDYFSVDRTPNMSVLDAVCMSIALPFLFSSSKFNEWHYVDGGAAEDCPCGPFIDKEHKDVLALKLAWSRPTLVKDLKSYGLSILWSVLKLRYAYSVPTIHVDLGNTDVFDFGTENEAKLKMFIIGHSQQISI
jgi:predicted acylesterase/phospholipase RssA